MKLLIAWSLLNVDWPAIVAAALAGIAWSSFRSWQRRRDRRRNRRR